MAEHTVGQHTITDEQLDIIRQAVTEGRTPTDIANSLARIADLGESTTMFLEAVASTIAEGKPLPWEHS
ncbi:MULTISPECIES: hypothetical protein [Rhodococcus]|uniref:hypothetical protein n=1 Tax=Rhodococcus TaxID=1827 RepID=UPI0007D9FE61|nr:MULTISPECIES: hypothetical protein [Rhodococcus]APE12660.1 hypothetical protein BO226_25250 [Rhodococcus sp. 2G]MCF8786169.1 hypothetical protein [Rhodococcus ruber]UTM40251.1 hypothetical protein MX572_25430 [Rhodococcus pyridinivorans]WAL49700.1 hypothetical protein OQN32_27190 [Rhodococcus pyridinivorans]